MKMEDRSLELAFSREIEFPQLRDHVYLDHAGSTLFSRKQIDDFSELMKSQLFANPHSRHSLGQNTSYEVSKVRNRILQFFHTDSANYSVIFTSGTTASMKLVAECFDFNSSTIFAHLHEVHTSVLGMGEVARSKGARIICFQEHQLLDSEIFHTDAKQRKLVVFPGQCNFSGRKYPLYWVDMLQKLNWCVFLDAAALVSTSPLDLSQTQPDFVALSFYKIFGFPTGLGALLVRKNAETCFKKTFFGGGTVEITIGENGFHVFRTDFTKRMEDGTIPYLDIIALNHGFDAIESLAYGMKQISIRTFALAHYTYSNLKLLKHGNGIPVVIVYCDGDFQDSSKQGPIVTFNLQNSDGSLIGFATVEKVFESFNLHIRSGCFCNTGACQKYLGLTTDDLLANYQAGHVCGDSRDSINGKITGAIRASFGYMSTKEDADTLVQIIRDIFMKKKLRSVPIDSAFNIENRFLSHLFIYPIKSCQGTQVKSWPLGREGFLYDRKCFIQNSAGTAITLKHNAKLRDITPTVDLELKEMSLSATGNISPMIINLDEESNSTPISNRNDPDIMNSRICGRGIISVDCGPHASQWLSDYLQDDIYFLHRYHDYSDVNTSLVASAANYAPFLLLCSASLDHLLAAISPPHTLTKSELVQRMRPNLIVQTEVAFEEDDWECLQIGGVTFEVVGKCSRCQMVNVSNFDGQRSKEPLQSIIRLRGKEMNFGVLLRQQQHVFPCDGYFKASVLHEGDPVIVQSFKVLN